MKKITKPESLIVINKECVTSEDLLRYCSDSVTIVATSKRPCLIQTSQRIKSLLEEKTNSVINYVESQEPEVANYYDEVPFDFIYNTGTIIIVTHSTFLPGLWFKFGEVWGVKYPDFRLRTAEKAFVSIETKEVIKIAA